MCIEWTMVDVVVSFAWMLVATVAFGFVVAGAWLEWDQRNRKDERSAASRLKIFREIGR